MISSASLNRVQNNIPQLDNSNKQSDQAAGDFMELLNALQQEPVSPQKNLLAMLSSLFSKDGENSEPMDEILNPDSNHQENELQTRNDLIDMISSLLQKSDTPNPLLGKLEKTLHKTAEQKEPISFEKIVKLIEEAEAAKPKDGKTTFQPVQKAGEDLLRSTPVFHRDNNKPQLGFDPPHQFKGKEVVFQSFLPNKTVTPTLKSEIPQSSQVTVQQFFSEVKELITNQNHFKNASEFIEAKFSLTPEKLGDIEVKLSIHKGQVMAHFTAETLAGKEQLESQLSLLRSSLQQQGFQVDRLEISLAGQGLQHSFSQQEERSRQDQSQQRFSKKKINLDEIYQSHASLEEYKREAIENTINILA
ncbi:flagellar hook-length control protein FliK [Neobacillus cucumis]|uniref:flagellar hook-length control protein FliK n=1 Tax=Neobacillus cucumis TaxID=1740721 RepID=UPI0015E14C65|nr:flagellar hook-length control protein FliK [Neobacillus cucumis]